MNHHFLAWCLTQQWAMRPETLQAYAAVLLNRAARKAASGTVTEPPTLELTKAQAREQMGMDSQAAAKSPTGGRAGSIAVIPVRGTIVQYADQLDLCEGGTTTSSISQQIQMALADDTVGSILMAIHSPGGSVYGVQELAAEIRDARKSKPVVAIADSLAASAAYWIGSQAGEFYCTPGGEVGSIGVWQAHQDVSKMLAEEGITVTLIQSGKFKTEGNPFGPLGDEAQAWFQSRTDDYYSAFTADVAKGRGVPIASVRDGMGQGRVLGANDALAQNMVDGVKTMSEVIKKMQSDARAARSGRSAHAARELTIRRLSL